MRAMSRRSMLAPNEEVRMLTREDCLALCELDADVVDAIAEHEHLPEIVAAELGCYLVHTLEGELRIRRIILDDIDAARIAGNEDKARRLRQSLRAFARNHPSGDGILPIATPPGAHR
jgi:hypothetical protein